MGPVRALTAALAALLSLGVAGPAAAGDSWRVPRSATIEVSGHGYGHGHGLSQYGAEGAARQGLDHRQIAEFYYPGTTWGRARGRISVLLSADTTDDLVVVARPGLRVHDLATGEVVTLPDNGATRWRVTAARRGRSLVSHFDGEGWRRWRRLSGEGAFSAGRAPVTLVTPSGSSAYRGRLAAVADGSGSRGRVTVNTLRLEHYLRGVVPLEIPALWSPEAVRAQAVAARTYAAYERAHPRSDAYDICDTWSCQVYGGADAEHPAASRAVRATRRQVLLHDGVPAFTQFGSSSGGWTSAGSMPYLVAQRDPYDGWPGNPNHDWSVTLSDSDLERAWPAIGNLRRIVVLARDGNGEWGGRVRTIRFLGRRGTVTVSGDTMRSALGLRSTWVTFRVD